jgi:hypothetical protein
MRCRCACGCVCGGRSRGGGGGGSGAGGTTVLYIMQVLITEEALETAEEWGIPRYNSIRTTFTQLALGVAIFWGRIQSFDGLRMRCARVCCQCNMSEHLCSLQARQRLHRLDLCTYTGILASDGNRGPPFSACWTRFWHMFI